MQEKPAESNILPPLPIKEAKLNAGRPKRVMGRSSSMFQQPAMLASSSRSSTPTHSINSSESSKLTSTPPSTISSDSLRTRRSRKHLQPVVEIPVGSKSINSPSNTPSLPDDPAAIPYDVPRDVLMPSFAKKSTNASRDLARVWDAVAGARRITVICGAGISVSSPANIPDFRSTAGLFRKLKEKHPNAGLTSGKDLFDASLFNSASTSSIFYSMIAELKAMADAASPTTFHHLLKRLDMEGRLQRVYTQNIDGLEERAGLSFGLGETGDSRAALRALGKRKRDPKGFARSKSDSAVLFTQKQEAEHRLELEEEEKAPMFPRTIPLHGSLSTLTCGVCSHKIYLSLASSGPQGESFQREYSPDAPNQALAAMDLLSQGESVSCVKCQDYERVRSVAGLRSRGVGIMKVDVVLYNGQNDGAEQVGDCVQRDILGLRDPHETGVPESMAEKQARQRREKKESDAMQSSKEMTMTLKPIIEASTSDDAFSSAFGDEEGEGGARQSADAMQWAPPTPTKKQPRAPRLKPLPPDLLIVAGTSLKVPGTKRIVREFAKACHARDRRVYPDSDESGDEDETETKTSRASSKRKTSNKKDDQGTVKVEEEEEEEEEEDINAPIRTILLNYDFPVPPSQWEGVFDVWVQGDVQQSALGLWEASKYAQEDCINGFSMTEDENQQLSSTQLSWSSLMPVLDEERRALKKTNSRRSPTVTKATTPPLTQSQQAKSIDKPSKSPKSTPVKVKIVSAQSPAKYRRAGKSASSASTKEMAEAKAAPEKAVEEVKAKAKKPAAAKKTKEAGMETYMRPTKSTSKASSGKKPTK
jgi:NAD-dependent SIR2 family protein deacetylase